VRFVLIVVIAFMAAFAGSQIQAQGIGQAMEDYLVRGQTLLAQKRPNEAIVQFQEVRTLCPNPVQMVSSLLGEARARLQLNELLPAAGLLEEAANDHPDDPRVADMLYRAGYARQRAGDYVGAVPLYRRALESDPPRDILPGLKMRFAHSLRLTGEASEAVSALVDFEQEFPGNTQIPNALYSLAIAQHDADLLEDSAATYQQIIDRFPGSAAAVEGHYELALVLGEMGRRDEAVQFYRDYVSLVPNSPMAAKALENAANLMLFRSPGTSAQLYALAAAKAEANPQPRATAFSLGRWFDLKRTLANTLSRTWVLILIALLLVGGMTGIAMLGRRLMRRRQASTEVGA
jgi:TolA-binding protein